MIINRKPPIQWTTGEILNPEGINENNQYFSRAFDQVVNKRIARWTTTYSMCPDVSTPLTSGSSAGFLIRKIPFDSARAQNNLSVEITIESFSLVAYYSSPAPITISINAGAETVTLPTRSASLATTPYYFTKLCASPNSTENLFVISALPTGATITKLDITVGFSSDKFECGDNSSSITPPTLTVPEFTDVTVTDAVAWNAWVTQMTTASAAAITGRPGRWIKADFYDISSATHLLLRLKDIPCWVGPSFSSGNRPATIIGAFIDCSYSGALGTDTVRYGLTDNSGTFHSIFLAPTLFLTAGSSDSKFTGSVTTPANSLTYTAFDTPTNDKCIGIQVTGSATIKKATVYLILQ